MPGSNVRRNTKYPDRFSVDFLSPLKQISCYSLNFMVPNVHCRVHNSQSLVPILSQTNHHSTPTNSISLVWQSHLRLGLARRHFPLSFRTKTLCAFLSFSTREEHRKMTQKLKRKRISTLHYVGNSLQYQIVLSWDTIPGTSGIRKLNGPTASLNIMHPKLTTGRLDLHEAWSVVLCTEIKIVKYIQEDFWDSVLHYPNTT